MWLRREGYSQKAYGPPTFARLCSAVANPMGGQNEELAKKLASTLVSNENTCTVNQENY